MGEKLRVSSSSCPSWSSRAATTSKLWGTCPTRTAHRTTWAYLPNSCWPEEIYCTSESKLKYVAANLSMKLLCSKNTHYVMVTSKIANIVELSGEYTDINDINSEVIICIHVWSLSLHWRKFVECHGIRFSPKKCVSWKDFTSLSDRQTTNKTIILITQWSDQTRI